MSDLWNMWTEDIRELENTHMHCTNNDENKNEMDGIEVIDLCSVNQNNNDMFSEGKESAKQESQDKSKHDGMDKMAVQSKTKKSESTTKKKKSRMCNHVLGAHKQFFGRRAPRGTREGGEETRRKDRKSKTWRRTCRTYTRYKQLTKNLDRRI